MADLTANAALRFRYPALLKAEKWVLDSSVAQTIYTGMPMFLDVTNDTLNVRGFTLAGDAFTTSDKFIGIAAEPAEVLLAATEDQEIEIWTAGEIGFQSAVFTDANVGDAVYMSDSGTLAKVASAATNPYIGTVTRVLNGFCYVKLAGAGAMNASA